MSIVAKEYFGNKGWIFQLSSSADWHCVWPVSLDKRPALFRRSTSRSSSGLGTQGDGMQDTPSEKIQMSKNEENIAVVS